MSNVTPRDPRDTQSDSKISSTPLTPPSFFQNTIWMCVTKDAVGADDLINNGGISIFPTTRNALLCKPLYEFNDNESEVSPLTINILMSFHRHNIDLLLIDYKTMGKYSQTHVATSECGNICANKRW